MTRPDDRTLGHLYAVRQQLDRITEELVDISDSVADAYPAGAIEVDAARELIRLANAKLLDMDPDA